MIRRLLNGLAAVAGAGGFSQFPAFYIQYLQRLGGRLDQAQIQVDRIAAAARDQSLSLAQYLDKFAGSADAAYQRQGEVLIAEVADAERLRLAVAALAQAQPIERPLRILQYIDIDATRATLGDFSLGLPLTTEGLVYAAIGLVTGLIGLAVIERLLRGVLRRRPA
jgi:hypothetical protein